MPRITLILGLCALSACDSAPHERPVQQALTAGGNSINNSYQLFSDFETDHGSFLCDNCDFTSEQNRPGIAVFGSAPATTLYSIASMNTIVLSGASSTTLTFDYRVDTLPTETNDYDLIIGLCDTTLPPCNYGVWVELTSADDMWHCHSADDPNSPVDDFGPIYSISENTWENLVLQPSNDGTYFTAFVNGFSDCGTNSDTPTDTPLGVLVSMRRTAGASETFSLDYLSLDQWLGVVRDDF
jgi:hypothetical protein